MSGTEGCSGSGTSGSEGCSGSDGVAGLDGHAAGQGAHVPEPKQTRLTVVQPPRSSHDGHPAADAGTAAAAMSASRRKNVQIFLFIGITSFAFVLRQTLAENKL